MDLFDVVSCGRAGLPEFLAGRAAEELKRKIMRVEEFDRQHFGYPRHIFGFYAKAHYSVDIVIDYFLRNGKDVLLRGDSLPALLQELFQTMCSYELPRQSCCASSPP